MPPEVRGRRISYSFLPDPFPRRAVRIQSPCKECDMKDGNYLNDAVLNGIRESIANARPDLKREHGDLLQALEAAVEQRHPQKIMSILERLDIWDHYPAVRRPDGRLEPQPMPGGWTSWYGWMMALKDLEEAPYRAMAAKAATPDIPETDLTERR
jgi:hypothetical protein